MVPSALSHLNTEEVVETVQPAISEAQLREFRAATHTQHSQEIPLTFVTRFRQPEFDMLGKMKVDLRKLLHTEQEYRYLEPFRVGDVPVIRSRVKDYRERRGRTSVLIILSVESEFLSLNKLKATSLTTFVIREESSEK
jgi:hypothetical protein